MAEIITRGEGAEDGAEAVREVVEEEVEAAAIMEAMEAIKITISRLEEVKEVQIKIISSRYALICKSQVDASRVHKSAIFSILQTTIRINKFKEEVFQV